MKVWYHSPTALDLGLSDPPYADSPKLIKDHFQFLLGMTQVRKIGETTRCAGTLRFN